MPKSRNRKKKRNKAKLIFQSPESQLATLKASLEKQKEDLVGFQKNLDALSESHANHVALLSNFVRHDLKNYTHSIDGIVSTYDADDITNEQIESIKLNVKFIRNTLDDFAKLIVHNEDSKCEFVDLVTAIEIINRTSFSESKIDFRVNNSIDITFNIPFTIMFQLLNNLIVNAIKAFERQNEGNRIIELKAYVDGKYLVIKVCDNGKPIEDSDKLKLFDYGYSTTGGTGIGLYHAKHLCKANQGDIIYHDIPDSILSKCFMIILPIAKE